MSVFLTDYTRWSIVTCNCTVIPSPVQLVASATTTEHTFSLQNKIKPAMRSCLSEAKKQNLMTVEVNGTFFDRWLLDWVKKWNQVWGRVCTKMVWREKRNTVVYCSWVWTASRKQNSLDPIYWFNHQFLFLCLSPSVAGSSCACSLEWDWIFKFWKPSELCLLSPSVWK